MSFEILKLYCTFISDVYRLSGIVCPREAWVEEFTLRACSKAVKYVEDLTGDGRTKMVGI